MSSVFSLQQLVELTALPMRTIRYYIQLGLVDRPEGERRTAHYTQQHLHQLLSIKQWTDAGVSLERVGMLLRNPVQALLNAPMLQAPGSIQLIRQITLAPGLTINIDASKTAISDDQVRAMARATLEAWQQIHGKGLPT